MLVRSLLLLTLLGGCEKAEPSRSATPAEPAAPPRAEQPVDGVTIELPQAEAAPSIDERGKPVVSIDSGGQVTVMARVAGSANGDSLAQVEQALAAVRNQGFDEIYIEAHEDLPYSTVFRVMEAVKRAGFTKMQLLTVRDRGPLPRKRPPRPDPPPP